MKRARLMLVLGTRGGRLSDLCSSLAAVGDVVVATSAELLAGRADRLGNPPPVDEVVCSPFTGDLAAEAVGYAQEHAVDGVLTFSDDVVEVTAVIAATLGLPGQPVDTVHRFRDKSAQRAALAAAGLPVPTHATLRCGSADEVEAALAAVPLPAILKPTRGSGGALAFIVTQADQLGPMLAEVRREATRTGGAVDRSTDFILESLIVGAPWHDTPGLAPYVSVESVAVGGSFRHLAVTDRFPQTPPVAETGMLLPSALDGEKQQVIVAACEAALRACDFRHGLAHTELMLTATGPVVIEVNARAGGALPYLFPLASDVDLTEMAGRVALGELPDAAPRFRGHAVFVAPQHPLGVHVEAVHGLDQLQALPGVRVVIPLAVGGTSTQSLQNTLIAVVLGTVDTPEQGVTLHRQVLATLRPVYRPALDLPAHYSRGVPATLGACPVPPTPDTRRTR